MSKPPKSGSRPGNKPAKAKTEPASTPLAATSPAKPPAATAPARSRAGRAILWPNVLTVVSVAILIGAEVFGAAYAGGWAVANFFQLGDLGAQVLQGLFVLGGLAVMVSFVRAAQRVEPFVGKG